MDSEDLKHTYYKLLGLSSSADQSEVAKAIRSGIRQLQADTNSSKKETRELAEQKMKLFLEAKKVLLDERVVAGPKETPTARVLRTTSTATHHPKKTMIDAPEKMRKLVQEIDKEVIEPTLKIIEQAPERYRQARDEADHRFQEEEVRAKAKLAMVHSEVSEIEIEIKTLRKQAEEHLRIHQREPPFILQNAEELNSQGDALNTAKNCIISTRDSLKELLRIRMPNLLGFPGDGSFGGVLVGVSIWFLAISAGSLAQASTHTDWIGIIVGFMVFLALLALRRAVPSSALRHWYTAAAAALQEAQSHIDRYEKTARDTYQYENRHALERRKKSLADAETRYNSELAEHQRKLLPAASSLQQACLEFARGTSYAGANWSDHVWRSWEPASVPVAAVRLGTLKADTAELGSHFPGVKLDLTLPALIPFAIGRSLLFTATSSPKLQAMQAVQSLMLRLLATIPPGKLLFTLLDPVGLGQNVAAFMGLSDHEESLIGGKAWSESQHIEQRLANLTEHMATVIQKYLRTDYLSIEDYNRQAGEVAEPYRVLVVMDFPVNFSEAAVRKLVSIAQSGPRCGVHTFVVMDTAKPLPYGFDLGDLKQVATVISWDGNRFVWEDSSFSKWLLALDGPPPDRLSKSVLTSIGEQAKDAMKVQVPYEKLLRLAGLTENAWWRGATDQKLQVPLGPTGARKLQYLILGEGMANHALIVGRTGSGKSNLMHVIITTLALAYSPEEIQLYLIDFKKGVEFKAYAEALVPHAQVIAIESEREFGLSVLQGLNAELQNRGELFRKFGVNHIAEYRQKSGVKMPRILLIVDEFQEFFVQDDKVSLEASQILDRLARQGRAFGIHVILGSQTLAGSYTLPRSTLDQMAVRIALQCTEADSRLILADDNPAARLLSRPGEAVYNAATGLQEGNNLFQVALFTDEDRNRCLKSLRQMARGRSKAVSSPIIFEGHEPARLEACQPLNAVLYQKEWPVNHRAVDAWLGEPIAIRPPTVARFRRQSGSHLVIVTRNEAEGVGVLTASVLSIAVQQRPDAARFHIVNLSTADSNWAELPKELAKLLPHEVDVMARRDLPKLLNDFAGMIAQRVEVDHPQSQTQYLVILGLHRARDLREDMVAALDSSTTAEEKLPNSIELFSSLLREGPEVGIHVLAWCDTVTNLLRVDRRMLGEFGMRVAGAMSNDDSMRFIDDTAAAHLDRPHRLIYFDDEKPGFLEKFRPYTIPERAWLERISQDLRTRTGK